MLNKEIIDNLKKSKYGVIYIEKPIKTIDKIVESFTKEKSLLSRDEQLLYYNCKTTYFFNIIDFDCLIISVYYDCSFYNNDKDDSYNLFKQGMLSIARSEAVNRLFALFNYYGLNKHHAKKPYGCKAFNDMEEKKES